MFGITAKRYLLFFIFLLSCKLVIAQTGPGGVGSSSTNVLWLSADDISGLLNNEAVATWPDKSGNANDLAQPIAAHRPIYISNVLNGLPIIRFNDANNERLQRLGMTRLNSDTWNTQELSIVYVNQTTDIGDVILHYENLGLINPNGWYELKNSANLNFVMKEIDYSIGEAINIDGFHIAGIGMSTGDAYSSSNRRRMEFWLDGRLIDDRSNSIARPIELEFPGFNPDNGDLTLGAFNSGQLAATSHAGDFAEVIIFDHELNSAEQIIIHNYLAAKYNITITNDYYAYQSTHSHDVIGVGRETSADRHTGSISPSGLTIISGAGLDTDGEYFFVGSDDGDFTTWTATEAANNDANSQRLAREWRVSETGELGVMTFRFDVSQMPALPSGYTDYVLMVDSDGDFSSGAKVYEVSSISGNEYSYSLDVADGDYLAIGILEPSVIITQLNTSRAESNDANFEVSLNYIPSTDVTLNITSEGSSAIPDEDYEQVNIKVVIPSGFEGSVPFVISVNQDTDAESDETFKITISPANENDQDIGSAVLIYTIEDSPYVGYLGPGGVGDNATNVLWVKADEITSLNNGDDLSQWDDFSGNANNLGASTSTLNTRTFPAYITGVINGLPVVRFSGDNDRLVKRAFNTFPTSAITAIYLNKTTDSGDGILSYAISGGNSNDFLIYDSNSLKFHRGATEYVTGVATNNDQFNRVNIRWRDSDGSLSIFLNGTSAIEQAVAASAIIPGGSFALAGEQDDVDDGYDPGQTHQGDFAEVMLYNVYLNTAQNIIIDNYLAAKYGLTPNTDLYSYEADHPHDVAGIGRVDADNIHKAAMSDSILRIEKPSNLTQDGSYLLFGHNDGALSWDGTAANKLLRDWRLDKTGEMGSVDVVINTVDLPTLSNVDQTYVLLVDADGDFSAGAITYFPNSNAGNEYKFEGLTLADGSYLSIGYITPSITITTNNPTSGIEANDFEFDVSLNFSSGNDVTVEVGVSSSSADDSDYTLNSANNLLTIPANSSTATFTLYILDDVIVEEDEEILISVSNAIIAQDDEISYTILNDDQVIVDFGANEYIGFENTADNNNNANPSIAIESNQSLTSDLEVSYTIYASSSTAAYDDDYTIVGLGNITIPAGATTAEISVQIQDDGLFEGGVNEYEIFYLDIDQEANPEITVGNISRIAYRIYDNSNSQQPNLGFTNTTNSNFETSDATIDVNMSTISGVNATVDYTITGGTATQGTDYTLQNGTLTIPAGSTMASIDVSIVHDELEEGDETIILELSNPSQAALGGNTIYTYTILDAPKLLSTGPGGVGDYKNNILWLRVDELIGLTDNEDINSWPDNSGNENALDPPTNRNPTYVTGVVNGFPAVRFDDTENDLLTRAVLSRSDGLWSNNDLSLIYVNKTTDSNDRLFNYEVSGDADAYYTFENSQEFAFTRNQTAYSLGSALNDNTFHIAGIGMNVTDAGSTIEYWVDGSFTSGSNDYDFSSETYTPSPISEDGSFTMGGLSTSPTQATSHAGDFTEVIVFDDKLNSAEQIIIHNYLAAKYNLVISNDYYAHQATHKYHVIGVGRETSTDKHEISVSESGIGIEAGAGLDTDGEYFILGSDNGDFTTWTATEAANNDANSQRLAREWRVSETGELGEMTFKIDASQMPALPSGYTDYVLMVDSDGDFSSGAKVYEPTSSLATVYSYLLDVADGDYLAIGIIDPTLSITQVNTSNAESNDANFEVSLNYIPNTDVTLNITSSDETATAGEDYEGVSMEIVIPSGFEGNVPILVSVNQDDEAENDETFEITVSPANPNDQDIVSTDLIYTIEDSPSVGYLGPGGVGDHATNVLWVKADEITGIAGDGILEQWDDFSGNDNDLGQSTSKSNEGELPTYRTGVINGLPVVRFSGDNDRLVKRAFNTFPTSAITAIYLNKTTDSGDGILSYAISGGNSNEFLIYDSNSLKFHRGATDYVTGVATNNDQFNRVNIRWRESDGSLSIFLNGTSAIEQAVAASAITSGGSFALAGEQDDFDDGYDPGQTHQGDFAEVMLFNVYLNTAQSIIIDNYLAAKYGLTPNTDLYSYEADYSHDVAGIGRVDADNIHKAAMSDSILRIEKPSNLTQDGSYLLFGHNDGALSWDGTAANKLLRDWRLDKTGEMGSVDVVINSERLPDLPEGTSYVLLVDADGDFSAGTTTYLSNSNAGSEYKFEGLTLADGSFLSIGYITPTLTITTESPASGAESDDFEFAVSINFTSSEEFTLEVDVTNVTADNSDYNLSAANNKLIIPANSNEGTFTLDIVDDSILEGDEDISVSVSNAFITLDDQISYTILNDDKVDLWFNPQIYIANETNVIFPSIEVKLEYAIGFDLELSYTIDDVFSIAAYGEDYTLDGYSTIDGFGTITILAGATTAQIPVTIIDDQLYEQPEPFYTTLNGDDRIEFINLNPQSAASPAEAGYLIVDNDNGNIPAVSFSGTSAFVNETVGTASIGVSLSQVSGAETVVDIYYGGSTATSGSDYMQNTTEISIPAGQTEAFIELPIIHDMIEESQETVVMTLESPEDATLGSNITFTLTIIDSPTIGITGPGGVGNSTTNVLWLVPDSFEKHDSDVSKIEEWIDLSGNANNVSQSVTGNSPVVSTVSANGYKGVLFDGADDRLLLNPFSNFPTSAITALYVNATSDSDDGLLSYSVGGAGLSNEFLIFNSNSLKTYINNTEVTTSVAVNNNAFTISGLRWQSSDGSLKIEKNGDGSTQTLTGPAMTSGGSLSIGGRQNGLNTGYLASEFHQGTFTEIIMYNTFLNETQNIIVNNYLSAKYDIALAANNIYDKDDGVNGDFDFEVAGIGQVSISDRHLEAQGTGIVSIGNPRGIGDNEFLIWGHNNADLKAASLNVPMNISRRLDRVWRVSQVDISGTTVDVGAVDLNFDLTNLGSVRPEDLVLLIDSDGDFSSGATEVTGATTFNESDYGFSEVVIPDNSYFTLATRNTNETPLPVELLFFEAEIIDKRNVKLNWATTAEVENSYFDVERSTDGIVFESIVTIPGSTLSEERINYNYTDLEASNGRNYYRLKQVDNSGAAEYSKVASVSLSRNLDDYAITLYPNPAELNSVVNISYLSNSMETMHIKVINSQGVTVLDDQCEVKPGSNVIELNTKNFNSGVYIISLYNSAIGSKLLKLLIR
ncbi:Calx-beta domain-containing protein [Roseivirga misakiensis]|uniref:Calx-beta domain-containing protein n=1 Tax=Roseivirga misakiensis TaxID=1563681 RepID=A0A1E5SZM5_9BACT|nr:Calx-beta domain-containing protein [Roseivirga misakiensis]OEK04571.1 hypothetical protein BFP71_13985 [Roseivirga misakiensis]